MTRRYAWNFLAYRAAATAARDRGDEAAMWRLVKTWRELELKLKERAA